MSASLAVVATQLPGTCSATDAAVRIRSLLSREAQLLVLTAGGPAHDAEVRRLLNGELNWPKLTCLAQRETATLIVWQSLQRVGTDVPPDVATAWRQLAMVSEFQSHRLERLLHQALGALATHAIDVMLVKGSALAYTAYASFRDRPMGDVDLLVLPDRAEEAWSLLQEEGWKWWSNEFPADLYRTHHHLPPLLDASAASVSLEIHRALLPPGHPFRLAPQTLWQRAQRITVDGQAALVPGPLHRLLHLCIHFAWSHGMRVGAWRAFRDLVAITGRTAVEGDVGGEGSASVEGTIDWAAFVDLARESRAATCCYWTLRLARSLAGAHVPDNVLQVLRPAAPAFVLNSLERHYVLDLFPTERSCPSVKLLRRLWELGIAPRWSEHGAARPWKIPWIHPTQERSTSRTWLSRFLAQVTRARASIGYVGRIIATPGHSLVR